MTRYFIYTKKFSIMKATITLKPFFIIDSNKFIYDLDLDDDWAQDLLIKRLEADHTKISNIIFNPYKTVDYQYNKKTKLVTLEVIKTKGRWIPEDAKTITYDQVDPHNAGSDLWMEGDISILNGDELKNTKYKDLEYIELGVEVTDVILPLLEKDLPDSIEKEDQSNKEEDLIRNKKEEKKDQSSKSNKSLINTWVEFRSSYKGSGKSNKEVGILWRKHKKTLGK